MLLFYKPNKIAILKNSNYSIRELFSSYKNILFKNFVLWINYNVLNENIGEYKTLKKIKSFIFLGNHSYSKLYNLFFVFYFNYYKFEEVYNEKTLTNNYLVHGLHIGYENKIVLIKIQELYTYTDLDFDSVEEPQVTTSILLKDISYENNLSQNIKEYFVNYNKCLNFITKKITEFINNKTNNEIYLYNFFTYPAVDYHNMLCNGSNSYEKNYKALKEQLEHIFYSELFQKLYYRKIYVFLTKDRTTFSFNKSNNEIINIKKFFIFSEDNITFVFDDLVTIIKSFDLSNKVMYKLVDCKELLSVYPYKQALEKISNENKNMYKKDIYMDNKNWLIFSFTDRIEEKVFKNNIKRSANFLYSKEVHGNYYNHKKSIYIRFSELMIDFKFDLVLEKNDHYLRYVDYPRVYYHTGDVKHYLYIDDPKLDFVLLTSGYQQYKVSSNLINLILDEDIIHKINQFNRENLFKKPFDIDIGENLGIEYIDSEKILSKHDDIFWGYYKITFDLRNLRINKDYLINNELVDIVEMEKLNETYYLFSLVLNECIISKKEVKSDYVFYTIKVRNWGDIHIKVQTSQKEEFYIIDGYEKHETDSNIRLSFEMSKTNWNKIKCDNLFLSEINGNYYIHNHYQYVYARYLENNSYNTFIDFICTGKEHEVVFE
ncbi:MAG: hypothetical protein QW255_05130 [Candidatus Bilamarchaeaceae archaeon]